MAKILDQPRYKCALSAMQTIQSIEGAIPILHSGPGCGAKAWRRCRKFRTFFI